MFITAATRFEPTWTILVRFPGSFGRSHFFNQRGKSATTA
jgi:hypothetical protein